MTWPFSPLTPLSYDVIICDPAWRFQTRSERGQTKGASHHYEVMSDEEIAALPVGSLAQRDCILLLWATAPMLPLALEVMRGWGFSYKSLLAWRKTTATGKVRMGTGYWARSMHEPVLIGTIGSPSKTSAFPSIFDGLAREHSRKPNEFYDLVRKHTSGLRRADLFARESREGFEGWGREMGKFDEVAA